MKYLDFRTETEKKTGLGYIAKCETCGHESIVGVHHGRYCPICGPGTIANVSFTKMNGTPASLHEVEITYELTLRRSTHMFLDDEAYESLLEGNTTAFERDMNESVREASADDFETDWAVFDIDTQKQVIDWD